MILGVGIDLCEVDRMEKALADGAFLRRFFTPEEGAYILSRGKGAAQSMAGHFAAKEALLKAMGIGITVPLKDIAVTHGEHGAPGFILTGAALARFTEMGGQKSHLSITHTDTTAAAVAIVEGMP